MCKGTKQMLSINLSSPILGDFIFKGNSNVKNHLSNSQKLGNTLRNHLFYEVNNDFGCCMKILSCSFLPKVKGFELFITTFS